MTDETKDRVSDAAASCETGEAVDAIVAALEQTAEDKQLSAKLAETADAWIDLQRPATEGEYLMTNLARRYEDLLGGFVGLAQTDPEAQKMVMTLLVKQLARAQADIFALKAAVLGRDNLALTRDWEYRDPLKTYSVVLGKTARASLPSDFGRYAMPLDPSVMGFGWYPAEEENGHWWRWSGPGLVAGLLAPRLFEGPARMEAMVSAVDKTVFPASGLVTINDRPIDYTLEFADGDDVLAKLVFDVDLKDDQSGFFMLGFRVAATRSPYEKSGGYDNRQLGIGLLKLEVILKTDAR
jgi:hypothetical protein